MHPWHDISPGPNLPEEVQAIVEISKGSQVKYELDKETGLLRMDRVLYSAVHYPFDYGFVPQTLWHDGDPLDIFILGAFPVVPMTLVTARIIGVVRMQDESEGDDKLLAVYTGDPRYAEFQDLCHIPAHTRTEIKHFLETYKDLQGKKVTVLEIEGAQPAREALIQGIELYHSTYSGREGNNSV